VRPYDFYMRQNDIKLFSMRVFTKNKIQPSPMFYEIGANSKTLYYPIFDAELREVTA